MEGRMVTEEVLSLPWSHTPAGACRPGREFTGGSSAWCISGGMPGGLMARREPSVEGKGCGTRRGSVTRVRKILESQVNLCWGQRMLEGLKQG